MPKKITYENKVSIISRAVPAINKCRAEDLNEIKEVVNENAEGLVVVSPTEPTGDNKNNVWFKKGKNLFDAYKYLYIRRNTSESYQINNSNSISVSGTNMSWSRISFTISNLIPNTPYIISSLITNTSQHNAGIVVAIGSTEKQSTSSESNVRLRVPFTTDSSGKITINLFSNWSSSNLSETIVYNNLQLEQSSVITDYEAYIEPEIYTRNDNEVYEKFDMKQNEIYSISETKIGTWIDGKSLYRKVIPFSPDADSNTVSIAHGISNLGVVIKCYGRFQSYSSNRLIPQQYYTLDPQFVVSPYSISSTNIEIGYGNWFKTSGNATNCYIIVEYTKTTD